MFSSSISSMQKPYQAVVVEGKWEALEEHFNKDEAVYNILYPTLMTVAKDSAFHIAVHSKSEKPLKQLLDRFANYDEQILTNILNTTNAYENTVLHEAAINHNIKAVKLLVGEGYVTPRQLLKRNESGQTPLFKAAAFGSTEVVKYLASRRNQMITSFHGYTKLKKAHRIKKDGCSILHAAVLGENFGTALELLKLDKGLAELKTKNGMTSLHLLTNSQSAFTKKYSNHLLHRLLYFCIPTCDYDNYDDAGTIEEDKYDVQVGDNQRVLSTFQHLCTIISAPLEILNKSFWKYFIGDRKWPTIVTKIWKEKRKRKFAFMLAKELIKIDCSWEMSYNEDTSKNYKPNINGPKDDDPTMKQKAADQQTDQAAEDYKRQAETPLLAATRTGVIELVKETLNMHPQAVETPLLAATRTGVIELVKEILNMHPQTVLAATRTRVIKLVNELLNMHPQAVEPPLLAATRIGVIELVKEILNMHPQAVLAATRTRVIELVKELLTKHPQAVETPLLAAIRSLLNDEEMPGEIVEEDTDEDTDDTEDGSEMAEYYKLQVETPLLAATRTGVIDLVNEILKKHPQAVEHVSHNMQNILHLAASYRRRDIFELVKKIEIPTRRLIMGIDKDGYSVLHHVADNSNYNGGTRPGPAYQLQEELEWFQMVEEIMPSYFTQHHDKNNKTAKELFSEKHKNQLEEAQKWIKETSQSCSAVAVLVATVVFAAAFTVPGGNDDKEGFPLLIHSPFFMSFTLTDVVSLSCSLTALVMFLSIVTSPFDLENFHVSLPRRLTVGFAMLFMSVLTTMLTFTSTIILIIQAERRQQWTLTLMLSCIAFVPVSVLALTHFPLFPSFIKAWYNIFKFIWNAPPFRFLHKLVHRYLPSKDQ